VLTDDPLSDEGGQSHEGNEGRQKGGCTSPCHESNESYEVNRLVQQMD